MCGRYYVDDELEREVLRDIPGLDNRLQGQIGQRDVFPTNMAPVVAAAGSRLCLREIRWGYPGINQKGVIINARAETVDGKRMFRTGMRDHRVIVPARHFYEWNQNKEKFTCRHPASALLYLAGVADLFADELRFVILTTQANASMERIHDRMPLILDSGQAKAWIRSADEAQKLLRQTPELLTCTTDYQQLSLFDL